MDQRSVSYVRLCLATFLALVVVIGRCSGRALSDHNDDDSNDDRRNQIEEQAEDDSNSRSLIDELRSVKRLLEREEMDRELETARRREQQELQRQERAQKLGAYAFLEKFGYLPVLPTNTTHDPVGTAKAVRRMQRMYHLNETGKLDGKTIEMMQVPRCGMPDAIPEEYATRASNVNQLRAELKANNFYVPGAKWKKTKLTWRLKNYHHLSPDVTKAALNKAFKFWSDVSGLTFTETQGNADINMEFVWGAHSDGPQNAFDGPGGVLAHAFYPESGETHFDSQESWTDGVKEGINLMTVAAHELGHALGLGHSSVQGALMAPYYQGFDPNFKLPNDDIQAIQTLYGGAGTAPSPPKDDPTKNSTTEEKPNTCDMIYKAVTQTHDYRVYIYSGRWMWRVSEYGLDEGFPLTISTYYENPPEGITAAIFSWKTYHTYFFKGKKLWKYYGFQLVDTKTSDNAGFPDSPKAAVASKDGVIYLFKAGNMFRFDEETLDVVDSSNPISIDSMFPGAPTAFDSLVRLANDPNIYFFKGKNYFKYSEDSRAVLDGYPKVSAAPWMGPACGGKPYTPK